MTNLTPVLSLIAAVSVGRCQAGLISDTIQGRPLERYGISARGLESDLSDPLDHAGNRPTIKDYLLALPEKFSGVVRALNSTEPNMLEQLGRLNTRFTVFAPNDEAYEAMITDDIRLRFLKDEWLPQRTAWIQYHILGDELTTADWLTPNDYVDQNISLVPSSSKNYFMTLEGTNVGLDVSVDSNGEDSFTVNGNVVLTKDVQLSNGIVHEIDGVFQHRVFSDLTIVDRGFENSIYSIAMGLITQAGLLELGAAEGPLSILAFDNKAAQHLHVDTENDLDTLRTLLTYHVVPGRNIMPYNVNVGEQLMTANGERVSITEEGVNDAVVTRGFVILSNGIVVGLNRILIPPSLKNVCIETAMVDHGDGTSFPLTAASRVEGESVNVYYKVVCNGYDPDRESSETSGQARFDATFQETVLPSLLVSVFVCFFAWAW